MNNSNNLTAMTVKTPADVRQKLQEWATANLTSMTAELVRSVRERAQAEREKVAGA
jgi:predicted transcriptional regulator